MNHAKKVKGDISESKILSKFIELGLTVSLPFGDNQRYDMIIDNEGQLFKIQCKSAWKKQEGVLEFQTTSCWKKGRENYINQIDFFAVYYDEFDKTYLVSIDEAPTGGSMYLRYETPIKNSPNINWAYDYEVEKQLNKLGL